jgi:hypothetical protein
LVDSLAGPHDDDGFSHVCAKCKFNVTSRPCNCSRRERVQAIALALEEAYAAGKADGRAETALCAGCHDAIAAQRNGYARGVREAYEAVPDGRILALLAKAPA